MPEDTLSDSSIEYAEKVLLGTDHHFTEEHIAFIQNWESLAVQACPGSGKTTSLLAKILILDKELPFRNNSGILVLSHTNAAVNEIKKRIEHHTSHLFSYPNFVGTAQEFTDRFFALPFARSSMGWGIKSIDDDLYRDQLLKKYRAVRWTEEYGKIGSYSRAKNMSKALGKTADERGDKQLADHYGEEKILNYYVDLADGYIKEYPFSNIVLKDPNGRTYKGIKKLIEEVHAQGVIPFHYAYILAQKYIDTHPRVLELVRMRFKYVFIDEMQDMSKIQYEFIEKLFGSSSSVVQYIGDNNQSIYNDVQVGNVWNPGDSFLQINGTMRLSAPIAKAISVLGVAPQDIQSLVNRSNLKPKLILFKDDTIHAVIPKFGEFVYVNGLHDVSKNSNNPIKIVGWRSEVAGDDKGKLGISSYSPTFKKRVHAETVMNKLEDFIRAIPVANNNGKTVSKLLLASILALLKCANIKDVHDKIFSSRSLVQMLEAEKPELFDDMKLYVNYCSQLIAAGNQEEALMEWGRFITIEFCPQLGIDDKAIENPEVAYFLARTETGDVDLPEYPSDQFKGNTYNHLIDDEIIFTAEIGTIHSVKGETHTATLYLESYFQEKHDSDRILGVLAGDRSQATKAHTAMNMKMAYVGMTRPTDLLCFAIHADRISQGQIDLLMENWDIEYV